jgi:hypothetical protein
MQTLCKPYTKTYTNDKEVNMWVCPIEQMKRGAILEIVKKYLKRGNFELFFSAQK